MVSIDDNVQVGLELTTSTLRLTGKTLIAIMDLFLQKDDKKNYYQNLKPETKQGKQQVKELFEKYENTEVMALDKNVSREEIKNIQKELKSMGVDFSIRKIEKDNYSLFFAGKDIEAIEKGISNSVQKHNIQLQRKQNIKEKVSSLGKNKSKDDKPKFNMNDLQSKHIEKQIENRQTKVKNKTPKKSL